MHRLMGTVGHYIPVLLLALCAVGVLFFFIFLHRIKPLKLLEDKLQLVALERFDTKLEHFDTQEFETVSIAFN